MQKAFFKLYVLNTSGNQQRLSSGWLGHVNSIASWNPSFLTLQTLNYNFLIYGSLFQQHWREVETRLGHHAPMHRLALHWVFKCDQCLHHAREIYKGEKIINRVWTMIQFLRFEEYALLSGCNKIAATRSQWVCSHVGTLQYACYRLCKLISSWSVFLWTKIPSSAMVRAIGSRGFTTSSLY